MNERYWSGELEVLCRYEAFAESVGFLVKQGSSFGKVVELEHREPGLHIEPTFSLSPESAQKLMDSMWREGFRPTEGKGSAGSLRATEEHLSDMRKIVSKKLGVNL